MGFDEFPPGRHFVAHQDREDAISLEGILDFHPLHRAGGGIHRGLPELLGHHFAKALETLDRVVGFPAEALQGLLQVSQLALDQLHHAAERGRSGVA